MTAGPSKFANDLYARGFLFFRTGAFAPPEEFRITRVASWTLALHESTRVSVVQADEDFVAVIGYAMDLETEHDDQIRIAKELLSALAESEQRFFGMLSHLGGRYAVVYAKEGNVSVVGDACATRTVFYANSCQLVGSHFKMLADMIGQGPSSQRLERNRCRARHSCYGYAAGATPDRNVSVLMANMVLRLEDMSFERFYPFGPLNSFGLAETTRELGRLFEVQANLLMRRFDCHVSLTAGLDSRVTLSAFRSHRAELRTFSYLTQPAHQVDVDVASAIARAVGVEHEVLTGDAADKNDLKEFAGILAKTNYHRHNAVAAFEYKSYFNENDVHVRSNLFEIGRAFYRSQRNRAERLDANGMAALYFRDFSPASDYDLIEEFDGYMQSSEFESALFNYDPFDVFYWEQRMSCWHAMVVLEADPAVETVLLFNSRKCIELALSLSLEDRIEGAVFRNLIRLSWPELAEFPVNPKHFVN